MSKPITARGDIGALALDESGAHVAIATDGRVCVHTTVDAVVACDVSVPDAEIVGCRLSGDGAFLVVVARSGEAHHVRSFRVSDGVEVHGEVPDVDAHHVGFAVSAEGTLVSVFDCYQMFEVVGLRKRGKRVAKCELFASVMRERVSAAITTRGDRVAVGWPGTVRVFEMPKSSPKSLTGPALTITGRASDDEDTIVAPGPGDAAELLGFTTDGKRLVWLGERSDMWQGKRRVPTVVTLVELGSHKGREVPYKRPAGYLPVALIKDAHVLWVSSAAKGGALQRQTIATGAFARLRVSTAGIVTVSGDGAFLAHARKRAVIVEPLPAK